MFISILSQILSNLHERTLSNVFAHSKKYPDLAQMLRFFLGHYSQVLCG